jgi:hypothetical protein
VGSTEVKRRCADRRAGVAALVYPILWVKQPALIVGGSIGDD